MASSKSLSHVGTLSSLSREVEINSIAYAGFLLLFTFKKGEQEPIILERLAFYE